MRLGDFEVLVVCENKILKETVIDGQTYLSALKGKEYHVQVNAYPDEKGAFEFKFLRVGLFIDGIDVGYWKRLDLSSKGYSTTPVSAIFWGFKENTDTLRSFVFAETTVVEDDSMTTPARVANLGTIRLVFHDAFLTSGTYDNISGVSLNISDANVSESKKFWKRASLTTLPGGKIESGKESFMPLQRWQNVSQQPFLVYNFNYHTSELVTSIELIKATQVGVKRNLPDSPSSGSKKQSNFIDLSGEKDVSDLQTNGHENISAVVAEEVIINDADVHYIEVEKIIPIVDITDETIEPQWGVIITKK